MQNMTEVEALRKYLALTGDWTIAVSDGHPQPCSCPICEASIIVVGLGHKAVKKEK